MPTNSSRSAALSLQTMSHRDHCVGEVAMCYYGQLFGIFQDIALELEHDHAGASSLLECDRLRIPNECIFSRVEKYLEKFAGTIVTFGMVRD